MKTNSYLMSPAHLLTIWHNGNWQTVIDIFGLESYKKGWRKIDEIWLKSSFINEDNTSVYLKCTQNIVKDLSSEEGTQNGFSD